MKNNLIFLGAAVALVIIILVVLASRGGKQIENVATQPPLPTVTPPTGEELATPPAQNLALVTIEVTSAGFSPQSARVKAEQKVIFKNVGDSNAQIASTPHPVHSDYPPLNLGVIAPGATAEIIFDKTGTYRYHNHLNPQNTGSVEVK